MSEKMVFEKSWKEFRESGLLWWANRALHIFGWAIVVEVGEDGEISGAYPARVKFRGFPLDAEENGFISLSKYMEESAEQLRIESEL